MLLLWLLLLVVGGGSVGNGLEGWFGVSLNGFITHHIHFTAPSGFEQVLTFTSVG